MLDIRLIRERPEWVKDELAKVGHPGEAVDQVLSLDRRRRELLHRVETMRAQRTARSREMARLTESERAERTEAMRALGEEIGSLEREVTEVEAALRERMLELPNPPHPRTPVGPDESANVVVRTEGEPRPSSFPLRPHWEIGPELGIIDFAAGVKLSGSRFYVLRGGGARLERALINWMLDFHVREHGYTEIDPPALVKRDCAIGAGHLPKFADTMYHDDEDDLWMISTAELPLTNLHRDEILEADSLPLAYVAWTPCFRREKAGAGRDVRGIKRVHQFDKVELYRITCPEDSDAALEMLVGHAEATCRALGIPHRVVQICSGDLGFSARMKYDIEIWAPGCGEWLEVSSCSNCGDFQARRANIRYRPAPRARPEFVHTLNGSGLALPRVMIAVLETYQQPDGSVVIPEVLRPAMGCESLGKEDA